MSRVFRCPWYRATVTQSSTTKLSNPDAESVFIYSLLLTFWSLMTNLLYRSTRLQTRNSQTNRVHHVEGKRKPHWAGHDSHTHLTPFNNTRLHRRPNRKKYRPKRCVNSTASVHSKRHRNWCPALTQLCKYQYWQEAKQMLLNVNWKSRYQPELVLSICAEIWCLFPGQGAKKST